ncbi:MAG: alpha/beta fold hydrolase [Solirubrobacteraceae bacterium]
MLDRTLSTADDRALLVQEAGDPDGKPILFHGGMPNSRLLYARDAEVARRHGVRLISYDRPAYGGSARHEGRTVADCAGDVRTIAAGLGIERLGIYGASGGGPHALACAALLEDLAPAVAVLASLAPWGAEGLDYFAGMGKLNVDEVQLHFSDRAAAREKCEANRREYLQLGATELLEAFQSILSPVDAAVLTDDFAKFFVDTLRDGLAPGSDGWWDDGVAVLGPWGFALAQIRRPVLLLHGRQDRFVPFAHGEWLARNIPGVEAGLTDEDGHLTLYENHLGEIYDWLLSRM